MAEREIERWVTINGNHVPIYKDDGSSEKKIADYANMIGNSEKAMALFKRTGINFSGRLAAVNPEVMTELCTTLEDLQNKYHINDADDPDSLPPDGYRLVVHVPPEYEHQFEGDNDDAFATAKLASINLNQKYYGLSKQEFDDLYTAGTQGYENFHPKGTTSKGIIAHEAAHHMLHKKVWEMCGRDYEKYFKIQEFLTDESEYTDMGETTMPEIKTLFGKFDKIRKTYVKELSKDEEAVKYLGHYLGEHRLLRMMAKTGMGGNGRYGICDYASKNYHELVAESFQDFYENGSNARLLSRIVVKEMFGFE